MHAGKGDPNGIRYIFNYLDDDTRSGPFQFGSIRFLFVIHAKGSKVWLLKVNLTHKYGSSFVHKHYTIIKFGYMIHTAPMCESYNFLIKSYNDCEGKKSQLHKTIYERSALYSCRHPHNCWPISFQRPVAGPFQVFWSEITIYRTLDRLEE